MIGSEKRIRHMPELDFKIAAKALIEAMAESYCGADITTDGSKRAVIECVRMLRQKFADIGLDEVREAFAMATAAMLGPETQAATTAFGGRFSVNMFGRVMANYMQHRAAIVAAIHAERDRAEMDAESARMTAKNEETWKQVQADFERLRLRNTEISRMEQIPVVWAKMLPRILPKDAELWVAAKKQVTEEFIQNIENGGESPTIDSRIACLEIIRRYRETGEYPGELYYMAEARYARLLIFNNLPKFEQNESE